MQARQETVFVLKKQHDNTKKTIYQYVKSINKQFKIEKHDLFALKNEIKSKQLYSRHSTVLLVDDNQQQFGIQLAPRYKIIKLNQESEIKHITVEI